MHDVLKVYDVVMRREQYSHVIGQDNEITHELEGRTCMV